MGHGPAPACYFLLLPEPPLLFASTNGTFFYIALRAVALRAAFIVEFQVDATQSSPNMASKESSSVPTLAEKHSGIPQNLLEKAEAAKSLIYQTRSNSVNEEKNRQTAIPQGVLKSAFFEAIKDLEVHLGKKNVEVNDKPLVDGWYMERKFKLWHQLGNFSLT